MITRIFLLGLLAGATSLAHAAGVPGSAVLREIDVRSGGTQAAQVSLALSHSTTYKLFKLENPSRVVLDLQDTKLAPGAALPEPGGIVDTVRTGVQPNGVLRVVFQVKSDVAAKAHWVVNAQGGERAADESAGDESTSGTASNDARTGNDTRARNTRTDRPGPRSSVGKSSVARSSVGKSSATKSPVAGASAAPSSAGGSVRLLLNLGDEETLAQLAEDAAPAAASEPRVVRAVHAPADSDRPVVVAVDAGHGGQDPGAIGRNGTREKEVVLAIARALAKRINAEPGMRAILTRDRDEFVPLRERIGRARAAKADLFVSVHADSIRNRDVSGSSVYVLSERGATDEAARWLAERENAADLIGGVSLTDKDNTLASVLLDLSNSANISASMTAAQGVLTSLDKVGEVRKPSVQQAGFVVLKSPDIPSMLVETAYISNPNEERRLRTNAHQAKLADAIFTGLRSYFEQTPPPGTLFARTRRGNGNGMSVVLASPGGGVATK